MKEENRVLRSCERCGETRECLEIPMAGYPELLCENCTAIWTKNTSVGLITGPTDPSHQ